MARIHLIDGEKGGVGKSLFARVMVQYAIAKKLEHALVDTESIGKISKLSMN